MLPRNLTRRIAAFGLAAALALPGMALARPARAAAPSPLNPFWAWFARLVELAVPLAPGRAGALQSASDKSGSTVDPDGVRRTALRVDLEPAPLGSPPTAMTPTGEIDQ